MNAGPLRAPLLLPHQVAVRPPGGDGVWLPLPEPVLELGRKTLAWRLPLGGWGAADFHLLHHQRGESWTQLCQVIQGPGIQVRIYPHEVSSAGSAGSWLHVPSVRLFDLKAPARIPRQGSGHRAGGQPVSVGTHTCSLFHNLVGGGALLCSPASLALYPWDLPPPASAFRAC